MDVLASLDPQTMNNTNAVVLKPLTREDLHPSPPLRNRHKSRGPPSNLRALGYLTPWPLMEQYAVDNKIAEGDSPFQRATAAWNQIRDRLPPESCTYILARDFNMAPCFVIGSNKNPQQLKRAEDLDLINRTRSALGIDLGPPGWYAPGRA
ncbi:hypothetical protein Hypma_001467 [Hypsizygus marmoreus]|uniref:Uncharacterized protein n=1 Tax=Hypsizygus marmoreus TaxID=39966 RepID=A0A369K623_HYPMA|nr:hypothetical protein Hypma_001467 [Hypsizygus marmoreus]